MKKAKVYSKNDKFQLVVYPHHWIVKETKKSKKK